MTDAQRPREFWIDKNKRGIWKAYTGPYADAAGLIHVIEMSAFNELLEKAKAMHRALHKVTKRNDIGEAALDYYGECASTEQAFDKWLAEKGLG